jgi:signal peptidase I
MNRKTKAKLYATAIAGGLGVFCVGLGLAYLGRRREAVAAAATLLAALLLASWSRLIFSAAGFYLTGVLIVLIVLGSLALSLHVAWNTRTKPPSGKRWDLVVFGALTTVVFYVVVMSHRNTVLGYEMFPVSTSSMGETLIPGDYFLSNVRKYRDAEPQRYDVVVYQFPGEAQIKYVGRVVGLPGERIEINGGRVHVNGARLSEPYVNPEFNQATLRQRLRYVVPKDQYFVMGDYRDRSSDSRYWGTLPRANVYGTVEFVAWSSRPAWQYPGDKDWDKDRRGDVRWQRLGKTIE